LTKTKTKIKSAD